MAVAMDRPATMWTLDIRYEFSAPHFFDFASPESEAQIRSAEAWFEMAAGYDPSPYSEPGLGEFLGICDYTKKDHLEDGRKKLKLLVRLDNHTADDKNENANCSLVELCTAMSEVDLSAPCTPPRSCNSNNKYIEEAPSGRLIGALPTKRLHSEALEEKEEDKLRQRAATKKSTKSLKRLAETSTKRKQFPKSAVKPSQAPEVRPFKRQKLDGESQSQAVKCTPALTVPRAFQLSTDKRAQCRGEFGTVSKMSEFCSSFVSLAEQVQRFYFKTPERFHKKEDRKFTLGLTKPKTPDLETSHRSRPPRVKSTAELEEEMLAKLPKFKARPANKKILEAPTLPAPPRSIPQPPHFEEFNLKTTERALQHTAQKDSHLVLSSTENKKQRRKSAPGGGPLHFLERIRPSRPAKTTEELQLEELAKVPKFKARPFNKKMFDNPGGLAGSRTQKRQVTEPVEFKFATAERCHHHEAESLKDSFRRLSLDSHPRHGRPAHGKTKPVPFHLLTEDRGASKMAKFFEEVSKQMLNESIARIPKANLLPLTTDFPAVPPKPAMKPCTRPEPFQLESLLRHEQELQRIAEERARAEQEEAEARKFRAQPIQRCENIFVPEPSRRPLTEIKEFEFQVGMRAAQRAEFEKKMLEKQNQYKKLKEEWETLRKEEEEKFIKALRKEMVPQARPMPLFDKTFVPQRSSKPLTLPVSPRLNTARNRLADNPFAPSRKFRMR